MQADGTMRLGPAFAPRQPDRQQTVELSDMPLKPESRTTSSLGLGVTPTSSHQDLSQMQYQQHGTSPRHHSRPGSRLMPSNGSFDDFGDQRGQSSDSVPASPYTAAPQPSPFMSTLQQQRAVPDPAAPLETESDEPHVLDRSHSMHSGRITRWWGRFDAQYMQPVFGGPAPITTSPAAGPHAVSDPNAPVDARPHA